MKKLVLNELESLELQRVGAVEITRNGYDILVEKEKDFKGGDYRITIINPYDTVSLFRKDLRQMLKDNPLKKEKRRKENEK
jgi:hypothetical protein